jgi:excisionase family DNA binding protein
MAQRKKVKQIVDSEPLEPLLSIQDVARLLQISRPTVYKLFREGLPYVQLGGSKKVIPSSLRRYLAQCELVG